MQIFGENIKKLIRKLSKNPSLFDFLRKIVEFDFIAIKRTIRKELSLEYPSLQDDRKRVIDIGCGTGEFCSLFNVSNYLGIDISKNYIDYAQKKYKHRFCCCDAQLSGCKDAYFDVALIIGVLHHLDNSSIESVLAETKRVLKEDGKVLLIEDIPIRSKFNLIGKLLQKLDIGHNIRPIDEYKKIFDQYFTISKYYKIRNGFLDYSVFVLLSR